jgi:hypothetical protein
VRVLGQAVNDPRVIHWEMGKQVLRYIINSKEEVLHFHSKGLQLSLFTDATFASEKDGRSVLAFAVMVAGGCLIGKSKVEGLPMSAMDAEFAAMSNGIRELMSLKDLMESFWPQEIINVYCDNTAAISVAKADGSTKRSRLIRLRYLNVKEHVLNGEISVSYLATNEQAADLLTKNLGRLKVVKFRDYLLGKNLTSI